MMKNTRTKHTPEFKTNSAIAALSEQATVPDLAKQGVRGRDRWGGIRGSVRSLHQLPES